MKRFSFLLLVVIVAVLGFAFGRSSGNPFSALNATNNHSFPLPPPPPDETDDGSRVEDESNDSRRIILEEPAEGAVIYGDFTVTGRANIPSDFLFVSLKDSSGNLVSDAEVRLADIEEGDEFARFSHEVAVSDSLGGRFTLDIYWSEEGGSKMRDRVLRPVVLVEPDTVILDIYFHNSDLDPTVACERVYPVQRKVSRVGQVYRSAIEELLSGPTDEERASGYNSSLPERVVLKSVAADADGVVKADFSSALEKGVGGSCRVQAIRAQIVSTLEQFPEVRDVIISVEGEVEEALQP